MLPQVRRGASSAHQVRMTHLPCTARVLGQLAPVVLAASISRCRGRHPASFAPMGSTPKATTSGSSARPAPRVGLVRRLAGTGLLGVTPANPADSATARQRIGVTSVREARASPFLARLNARSAASGDTSRPLATGCAASVRKGSFQISETVPRVPVRVPQVSLKISHKAFASSARSASLETLQEFAVAPVAQQSRKPVRCDSHV